MDMFTLNHFIWLGICAVLILSLTYNSLKRKWSFKTAAFIMAGTSLVSEFSKIMSNMQLVNGYDSSDGMVIKAEALPFHLCSLLIFAFFYLPFGKSEKIKGFLLSLIVPVGLIGSFLALIMATSGTDFTTPDAYQCFIYHSVMIWFAVYLAATDRAELGIKAWLRNSAILFSLAIIMLWVNGMLQDYNTNFLYVVRPPAENLPILNLNHGWYAYFASIMLLGFIGLTVVHLPAIIKEIKKNKVKI